MLDIDNKDRKIAKRFSSLSEIGEGFVARGINNQETWNLDINFVVALIQFGNLLKELVLREEGSSDLLGDAALLSVLDLGVSDLVK